MSASPTPSTVLHMLGQCTIVTSKTTITYRAGALFSLATYLIARRGVRLSRSQVRALMWDREESSPQARQRLRSAVYKLRHMGLPIHGDGSREPYIWLERGDATTDVEQFIRTDSLEFLATYDGQAFPGFIPTTSARLADWFDDFRDRTRVQILARLTSRLERSRDDLQGTLRTAMHILRIDPWHERAFAVAHRLRENLGVE